MRARRQARGPGIEPQPQRQLPQHQVQQPHQQHRHHSHQHEHEFEAEPGLPEPLPAGERLLWQGSPDWRVMAREAMHTRLLSIYFGLLLAWRGGTVLANGGSPAEAGWAVLGLLPLAAAAIGLLVLLAWLVSRTSVYTVTDKRVVMRIGVVLGITFNLPYSKIESAGLRRHRDGSGDLTLVLAGSDHIAYAHLWPHARPWHLKRTQPMLRAVRDGRGVATLLAAALTEAAGLAGTGLAGAGLTSAGLTDGGLTDGGLTDGGPTDGGPTDGGPTDGGLAGAGLAGTRLANADFAGADQSPDALPPPSSAPLATSARDAAANHRHEPLAA